MILEERRILRGMLRWAFDESGRILPNARAKTEPGVVVLMFLEPRNVCA